MSKFVGPSNLNFQNLAIISFIHFQFDNTNPGLWRMASKEDPMFMALTDVPYAQHFDIDTLDTIGLLSPAPEMKMMTACTHWQREPGTDNSISFYFKVKFSNLSVISSKGKIQPNFN